MVKFETITGKEYNVDFSSETTFGEIKETLSQCHLLCKREQIYLLYEGDVQNDESKLKMINLEKDRFIVIYVEPENEIPNVNDMITFLLNINPNRAFCEETLRKSQYNMNEASNILIEAHENIGKKNNNSSRQVQSEQSQSVINKNPFFYTPPNSSISTNNDNFTFKGLSSEEIDEVIKNIPKNVDKKMACELFIDLEKNIGELKKILDM